jgi:hypothetical protein
MVLYKAKNGNKYSEDDAIAEAENAGLSLDEFIINEELERVEEDIQIEEEQSEEGLSRLAYFDTTPAEEDIIDLGIVNGEDEIDILSEEQPIVEKPLKAQPLPKKKKSTLTPAKNPFGEAKVFDPLGLEKLQPKQNAKDKLKKLNSFDNETKRSVQEFRKATAFTREDIDLINKQFDDYVNPKTETLFADEGGAVKRTTKGDFKEELDQLKDSPLFHFEKMQKAKEMKRAKLAADLKSKKATDYMNSISYFGKSEKQKGIESYVNTEKDYYKTQAEEKSYKRALLNVDLIEKGSEYTKLTNELAKVKRNDLKTEADYINYKSKYDKAKELYSYIEETNLAVNKEDKDFVNTTKRLGSSSEEFDLAKRYYGLDNIPKKTLDTFDELLDDATLLTVIGGEAIRYIGSALTKYVNNPITAPYEISNQDFFSQNTIDLAVAYQKNKQDNENYYERVNRSNVTALDTTKHAGNLLISQLPNIVLGVLSGGAEPAAVEGAAALAERAVANKIATTIITTTAEKAAIKDIIAIGADDAVEAALIKVVNNETINGSERLLLQEAAKKAETTAQRNALQRLAKKAADAEAEMLPQATLQQASLNALKAGENSDIVKVLNWTVDKLKVTTPAEAVIFGSSTSQKVGEQLYTNTLPAGQGGTDYNAGQILLSSALWGLAETAGEKVQLKATGAWANTISKTLEEAPTLVNQMAKAQFKNVLAKGGGMVKNQFNEQVSEQITNVFQNTIDKVLLGKDVGVLDNTGTVFKDTALLAGMMSSIPHVAGAVIKPFMVTAEQKQIKAIKNEIMPLIAELKKPLPKDQKKVIQDRIKELTIQGSELHQNAIQRMGDMSEGTWKNIVNNAKALSKIQLQAKEIYNGNSSNKNALLKNLQVKYSEIDRSTNEMLSRAKDLNDTALFKQMGIQDRRKVVENLTEIARLEQLGKGDKSTAGLHVETIKNLRNENSEILVRSSNENLSQIINTVNKYYGGLGETVSKVIDVNAEFVEAKEGELEKASEGKSPEEIVKLKEKLVEELKNSNTEEVVKEYKRLLTERLEKDSEGKSEEVVAKLKKNYDDTLAKFAEDTKGSDVGAFVVSMPRLDSQGKQMTDSRGRLLTDDVILINRRTSEAKGGKTNVQGLDAATIASHELLHVLLAKAFGINQNAFVPLANALLDHIAVDNPKLSESIKKYIELSYETSDGGIKAEEIIVLVSELISSGTLKYNESFFKKIGLILVNAFNNVLGIPQINKAQGVKLNTGKDVYEFLGSYANSFSAGKISEGMKLALKGGVSGTLLEGATVGTGKVNTTFSKAKVAEVQAKIDVLEDQYDNDDIEYDAYENKLAILKEELKKAQALPEVETKPKVEKPKVEINAEDEVKEIIKNDKGSVSSDKVQQIYEAKGLNGADEIIKLFRPITNKIVNKRRDAPGFDEDLLRDEIETGEGGILYLIRSYKPEKGVPLAAYINKQLPLRAIASSRRVLDKEFSKDVTEEKALMASEASTEVKEKPKYKNALESKVFSTEVLETANKKILPIVRTLKSRIDAPVSLNRTITPLISEIRDEIGKQLDIDVKTAMGGKKDNQLQNWLLDNKQYVLENMTTTWLMGKDGQGGMPIAIQKQIDGKWVSYPNWVGQKIDREKTTTDQAGRTSGAELVRRLPNVNNNISDSQFLDQVIGPDGNPLRGRKESLAKAVAEETAFDIINEDLANGGPISEALSANQERQGVVIAENFAVDFARQADRGNVKFSKELKLKLAEKLKTDVTNKKVVNLIVEMIQDIIKPTMYKRTKALKDKEVSLRDKLGNDLYEELYDEYLAPIADALETVRTAQSGKRGNAAEEEVIRTLNTVKNKDFKVISVKAAGTGSDAVDVKFSYKGLDINFEVKSGKNDRITSLNVHNYATAKKLNTSRSLNQKNKKGLLDQIDKSTRFNSFVKKALEGGATITENGSLEVDQKLLDKLTPGDNTLYKRTLISGNDLNIPMELVADINNRKGINYIGFGDIGIFYIGSNPLKLNVPALQGKLYSKAFLHAGKVKKNGKRTLTLKVYTQLTTATSNELTQKSKASIYSPESWDRLFSSIPEGRIEYLKNVKNAEANASTIEGVRISTFSKTPKGISVFDFDDTVGLTSGSVLYTMPDGSTGKLNAEEFAKEGGNMLDAGAEFDFSEFSKVVDGKPGPMVDKMKKMIGKFGPENFFILTARPANSAGPIHEFLSSIGIDIPLENITGLGSSLAQSKADWITAKAAEGYNDFYFADDAIQNVTAVKNALEVLDVKSKIQQARLKFSKTISPEFNKIIQENTGMEDYKVFSEIVARRRGAKKNRFDFYVPPSAADFELLLYNFIGKGARGEEQQQFFADALLKPYANGNDLMDAARQSIKNDYKALINQFPGIKNKIESLTPDKDFTYDQAIRVALWTEEGIEIPGLSQRDQTKLVDLVNNDPELTAFKEGVLITGRQGKGWVAPTEYWDASTIISDLHNLTEGAGRKKFLAEFIENTEEMFGKFENGKLVGPNMNKIEAVYGTNVREALEDQLYRMINGKNRSYGNDKETSRWSNWVNGSTGTIMFLNTRSAALQLIGAVNFLNLRDNNPIAAAAAFANQKQYWADFVHIWNSDKMKERRGGLKEDVAAAEIANAAAGSKNKANSVISYLLKIGYTPTQLADSFAIASGGAPFYRNRIKSYLKEGQTQEEAEKNAWNDFTKVSDETQQSGDPRDISKQQASPAGRLLLTFQNTAMQQSRIVKKSFLDLKNGRGDAKTHLAKIAYYLAIQNTLFAVLQQGLFAVVFDDDDEELDKEKEKAKKKTINDRLIDVADGVLDTILRGTGFLGGIISVLKNMTKKYLDEKEKDFKADYAKVMLEGANISPPIGSKLRKVYTGLQQTKFEKDLIAERGWGVTQDGQVHLGPLYGVTGKLVEAGTNLPMDRLVNKIENVSQAMNSQNQAWQRVAVGLGFTPYSVGIEESKGDLEIRAKAKEARKEGGKTKRKEAGQTERDSIANLSTDAYLEFVKKRKEARERKKDSIANLPADQKEAYLKKKEEESNARKREKEALKKIKADSVAGLSPAEKAKYDKQIASEKAEKKKERREKYLEKKKALQDSLAGLSPREREKYKAKKKAERHKYYIENKKEKKKSAKQYDFF